MELFNVPNNSKIIVQSDIKTPPASPQIKKGDILQFHHIDGMYSYCKNNDGEVVHLVAWADVDIVKEKKRKSAKKSIKKFIQVGNIIKTKDNLFYEITKLYERKFECKMIFADDLWDGHKQEFYYNVDLKVYKMIATNY